MNLNLVGHDGYFLVAINNGSGSLLTSNGGDGQTMAIARYATKFKNRQRTSSSSVASPCGFRQLSFLGMVSTTSIHLNGPIWTMSRNGGAILLWERIGQGKPWPRCSCSSRGKFGRNKTQESYKTMPPPQISSSLRSKRRPNYGDWSGPLICVM